MSQKSCLFVLQGQIIALNNSGNPHFQVQQNISKALFQHVGTDLYIFSQYNINLKYDLYSVLWNIFCGTCGYKTVL